MVRELKKLLTLNLTMKSAKEFYRNYQADDTFSELSKYLVTEIYKYNPAHALEFGSGSGKHLSNLIKGGIDACGLDISITNVLNSHFKNENKFLILGDETNLRHLCNFDVVFTCSVLDHIEDIHDILKEFKRIANKAVIVAETCDIVGDYYYAHAYKALGFEPTGVYWESPSDGAKYYIWKWEKQ